MEPQHRLQAQVLRLLFVGSGREACLTILSQQVSITSVSYILIAAWLSGLTMPIPELLHPQTNSKTHRIDNASAVLLRRVFVLRMNMGCGLRPGSLMLSNPL